MSTHNDLYTIKKDVVCLACGNKGAAQSYGRYYPIGMGSDGNEYYENYKKVPFLRRTFTLGGVIPYECIQCENKGFIDSHFGNNEGFQMAFKTIRKDS